MVIGPHGLELVPDDLGGVVIVVAIIAAVIAIVFLGPGLLALLVGAIELTIIVVACVAVIVWRTLRRRPWRVLAISADGRHHAWELRGWRRSRALVRTIAEGIETGLPPTAIEPAALQA